MRETSTSNAAAQGNRSLPSNCKRGRLLSQRLPRRSPVAVAAPAGVSSSAFSCIFLSLHFPYLQASSSGCLRTRCCSPATRRTSCSSATGCRLRASRQPCGGRTWRRPISSKGTGEKRLRARRRLTMVYKRRQSVVFISGQLRRFRPAYQFLRSRNQSWSTSREKMVAIKLQSTSYLM